MIQPVKRKDGSTGYRARVGKGPMKTFDRKRDAEEYEAKEKQNRLRVRAGLQTNEVSGQTFADLCELYKANFAPSQWQLNILGYSERKWRLHRLVELRPEQIGAWLHALPYAPKTKNHILSMLRGVLDAGVEWGYLSRNPARSRSFKAPSTKRVNPIRPFETWDEVLIVARAVASQGEPVSSPFVRFACATGLRCPGELLAMRWDDINQHDHSLNVRGTKTDAAPRIIPLSIAALAALKDVPRAIAGGPVWINRHGRPLDYGEWRKSDWRKGLAQAGFPHRPPYEMRHTFATLALGAGAAIDDVASAMGHTDIDEVFRFYRKWIPKSRDRLRGVLDTIGKEKDAVSQHTSRL